MGRENSADIRRVWRFISDQRNWLTSDCASGASTIAISVIEWLQPRSWPISPTRQGDPPLGLSSSWMVLKELRHTAGGIFRVRLTGQPACIGPELHNKRTAPACLNWSNNASSGGYRHRSDSPTVASGWRRNGPLISCRDASDPRGAAHALLIALRGTDLGFDPRPWRVDPIL
jgi:hypothetical protein